jgi:hypothetical protein
MLNKTKKKFTTVEEYIELISKDYQFNQNHPDYLGFINIDPNTAFELGGGDFREVAQKIAANPDAFEGTANKYGLTIESAWEDELIFAELSPKPRVNHLY